MFIRERFNYDIKRTHFNLLVRKERIGPLLRCQYRIILEWQFDRRMSLREGVWGGQQLRERYAEGTTHRGRGPPR